MPRGVRQLATETFAYGLAGVASGVLSAVLFPLYAHSFAPRVYGIMGVLSSLTALVSVLVVLGLDNAMARWYWDTDDDAEQKEIVSTAAWCQLLAATVVALALVALMQPLGHGILHDPSGPGLVALAASAIPPTTIGVVLIEWFRLRRRPLAALVFTLVTAGTGAAITAYLLLARHWGLSAVYAANLTSGVLGAAIAIRYLGDWVHPRKVSLSRLREMLSFSAPLIPAGIAYWVLALSDRFLLEMMEPLSQVGYYQVAATIAAAVGIVAVAFQRAWSPFALSIHKDPDAVDTYARSLIVYACGSSCVALLVTSFSPELLSIVGANRYEPSVSSLPWLAFAAALTGITYMGTTGLSIAKANGPIGWGMTIACIVNVLFNLALIPVLGRDAAAISTLLAEACLSVYLFHRSQRLLHVPYRFIDAAVLVGATFGASLLLSHLALRTVFASLALKVPLVACCVGAACGAARWSVSRYANTARPRRSAITAHS